jgi:hypothetical protein
MAKVHRLGRRRHRWWPIPVVVALTVVGYLVWPTESEATTYLVARVPIAAGEEVTAENFELQKLQLGTASNLYAQSAPRKAIALRSLERGQPVALSDLASDAVDRRLPVVLVFDGPVSHSVRVGSSVDVWQTPANDAEPSAIVLDSVVRTIATATNLGHLNTTVELRIEPEYLPALLRAKGSGAHLELILKPSLLDQ